MKYVDATADFTYETLLALRKNFEDAELRIGDDGPVYMDLWSYIRIRNWVLQERVRDKTIRFERMKQI